MEELVRQGPRPLHGFVLLVDVVIQVRSCEIGFVADIHDRGDSRAVSAQVLLRGVGLEDVVEAGLEGVVAAHEGY